MMLQLEGATITASSKGFTISCKAKELNNIFQELFKFMPKDIKVKDIKKLLVKKLH